MGEFVTQQEFTDMERSMDKGFNDVKTEISELKHSIENANKELLEKVGERFMKNTDVIKETLLFMDTPQCRDKIGSICQSYLYAPESERAIFSAITKYTRESRDQVSKWIAFAKLMAGVIISILVMYGGNSIIKTQRDSQKAISVIMQELQK